MKTFAFQQFEIQQSPDVFRVGTDGVLLGALSTCHNMKKILEIGTGTGLISMMLAQRNPEAQVIGIDIAPNAYELAFENFRNAPFSNRLLAINGDYNDFQTDLKFDLIVSNPPYFDENSSSKDTIARQRITLDFPILIKKSAEILIENGIFSVIIPSQFEEDFIKISEENSLFLIKKINIYGIIGGKHTRSILEFSPTKQALKITDFVIENAPRQYSEQYLEATKDFHIFSK